jgi:hypothetical protein
MEGYLANFMSLIRPDLVKAMTEVVFMSACFSVVLVMLAIGMFAMNVASLVDRILPRKKVEKVSNKIGGSNLNWEWTRRLMFWRKDIKHNSIG